MIDEQFIAGSWVAAHGRKRIAVLNPFTEQEWASVPDGDRSSSFATRDDALRFFDVERPNLVAAVELAATRGWDDHACRIPRAMYWYFALRKHWSDWLNTQQFALASARRLGDRHAAATMLNRLGNVRHERSELSAAKTNGTKRVLGVGPNV